MRQRDFFILLLALAVAMILVLLRRPRPKPNPGEEMLAGLLFRNVRRGDLSVRELVGQPQQGVIMADLALAEAPPVDQLIAALDSRDATIRKVAATTLGLIGDARAVEPLIDALRTSDVHDQGHFAWALGRIADQRAVQPLIDFMAAVKHEQLDPAVPEALGYLRDSRAVKPLIAKLKDAQSDRTANMALAAREALAQIGPPAVPDLLAALAQEDPKVREAVVRVLGRCGDARAVEPLLTALKDPPTRQAAARALGRIGDARAVEPLAALLTSGEAKGKDLVVEALKQIGPPALDALCAAGKHPRWPIRAKAAEALGELADPRSVPALVEALNDDYGDVRDAARTALLRIGPPAVEPLIAAAGQDRTRLRRDAARTLGLLGDARAVPALVGLLADKDTGVRNAAAEALGQIGDRRAVEPLALARRDKSTERSAALALARLRDQRVAAVMLPWLGRATPEDRQLAARCLGLLGDPQAVEPLIAAARNTDDNPEQREARRAAIDALAKLGDRRAVKPLTALLTAAADRPNKRSIGSSAAMEYTRSDCPDYALPLALARLDGAAAVEPLVQALAAKNWAVQLAAVEALGDLGDKRAVEPLIEFFRRWKGSYHRQIAAASALGKLGDRRAVEPLAEMLADPGMTFATAVVAEVLGRLGGDPAAAAIELRLKHMLADRAYMPFPGGTDDWIIQAMQQGRHDLPYRLPLALARLGDRQSLPLLRLSLRGENWRTQTGSAEAMGMLGDKRAAELLIAALTEKHWFVRQAAAAALGRLGDPRALGPLKAALADGDRRVRRAAREALAKVDAR